MKKIITLILVAVLMISFAVVANAAVGTVVKANKVDKAPNLEEIDESWGDPVISVTPETANTEFYKYWNWYRDTNNGAHSGKGRQEIEPENTPFDLYVCWDNKYIYIGILSPEEQICGHPDSWAGDGIQFWLQPLSTLVESDMTNTGFYHYTDAMTDPRVLEYNHQHSSLCNYYWSLNFDDYSVGSGGAAAECECYITIEDDMMHATIAVPLSNMGINTKKMDPHGYELGTAVVRIGSKSTTDEGYAGWLTWGKFFEYTECDSLNTIVLVDPAQGDVNPDTTPIATEPEVTEPEVTEPEVTEPEVTEPEVTEPEVTEPEVTEPEVTEPEVTEPEVTEPEVTEPEVTEPEVTEPEVTEPEVTEPEVTEPEVTEPEVTEPEVTEPEVTEPEVTEPEVTEPEATEPKETDAPATTDPEPKNNTGLIIGIVAAVVVVGAGLGIVLGKKKK